MWILQYVQHVLAEIAACLLGDTGFWIANQRKVEKKWAPVSYKTIQTWYDILICEL